MAVQSISPEDLSKGLPPVIGLPRCLPERAGVHEDAARRGTRARRVAAVPAARAPRSQHVPVRRRRAGRRAGSVTCRRRTSRRSTIEPSDAWTCARCGAASRVDTAASRPATTSGARSSACTSRFPRPGTPRWAQRLEAAYGLKYFAQRADEVGFTGIPDGGFKTICVPVPVGRLADLYRCFEEMRDDPRLMTPVSARLELRFGTINYVVGKSPAWTQDPSRLFAATFDAGDLLPLGWPQLEHGKDGSSAWTVRRLVYLASIGVPFAGVEFVVERLAERGLIKRRARADADPSVRHRVRCVRRVVRDRAAGSIGRRGWTRSNAAGVLPAQLGRGAREGRCRSDDGGDGADGGGGPGADRAGGSRVGVQRAWFEREVFVAGCRPRRGSVMNRRQFLQALACARGEHLDSRRAAVRQCGAGR